MCRMDENFLQEYIDGSLEPLEKIILEEHLRTCPACAKKLNGLKLIDWDLRQIFREEGELPAELSSLRAKTIRSCFSGEQEQDSRGITSRDIWNIQLATFNNSLKFITLLAPFPKREKPPAPLQKKSPLWRKIMGL